MNAGASCSTECHSSSCFLLNDRPARSYGTLVQDCEHCRRLQGGTRAGGGVGGGGGTDSGLPRRMALLSSSCSSIFSRHAFHSRLSLDTSRFSLCRMYGSQHTVGLWRSRSSTLTAGEHCCPDEQCCRSYSSQMALNDSPPTYRDARFFPVLIVHRPEGCGDASEVRRYYVRRGSCCLETSL